jgi:hypothetical protein
MSASPPKPTCLADLPEARWRFPAGYRPRQASAHRCSRGAGGRGSHSRFLGFSIPGKLGPWETAASIRSGGRWGRRAYRRSAMDRKRRRGPRPLRRGKTSRGQKCANSGARRPSKRAKFRCPPTIHAPSSLPCVAVSSVAYQKDQNNPSPHSFDPEPVYIVRTFRASAGDGNQSGTAVPQRMSI